MYRLITGGGLLVKVGAKVLESGNILLALEDRTHEMKKQETARKARKTEFYSRLITGVSHDLNNMLNTMVTYPDLLMLTLKDQPDAVEYSRRIKNAGLCAGRMIKDMLALTAQAPTQKIDSRALFNAICDIKATGILAEKMTTEFHADDNLYPIEGNSDKICMCIDNILRFYSKLETEQIGINMSNREVKADPAIYPPPQNGKYVSISFRGATNRILTSKERDRLFEPFFTKKRMDIPGTGLEMTIVSEIIEKQNGFISIKDDEQSPEMLEIVLFFPSILPSIERETPQPRY